MKKKLFPLVTIAITSMLSSCSGYKYPLRLSHINFKGYSAQFYDFEKKEFMERQDNLTWIEAYDRLISESKRISDLVARSKILHQCEDLVMQTGAVCPLYYYSDVYLKDPKMKGMFMCPMGYKFFNRSTYDDWESGKGKTISVCCGAKAENIDPALNTTNDGGILDVHLFEGLQTWIVPEEGKMSETPVDAVAVMDKEPIEQEDGTFKYTFRNFNSTWSDGVAVKPSDFAYSWSRAASGLPGAQYSYMFENIVGYEETNASNADKDHPLVMLSGVKADDNNNTLEVTLKSRVSYFRELCAFPAYFPVRKDVIEEAEKNEKTWWLEPKYLIGNGPMKCTDILNQNGGYFNMTKNPYYKYDDVNAIQSDKFVENINFKLSDDEDNQFLAYKTGDLQFIDSVSQGNIKEVKENKEKYGYVCAPQIGTYYIVFNVNDNKLNDKLKTETEYATFRKALSLMIDRKYICEQIGKAEQVPANAFVGAGALDVNEKGETVEWITRNGPKRNGEGYYKTYKDGMTDKEYEDLFEENCIEAVKLIESLGFHYDKNTNKFTDVPPIRYLYNSGSGGHKTIGEYLSAAFAAFGITMRLESQEWNVFLSTKKAGDYCIARDGWVADITDAVNFLDMWVSSSGNNGAQFGRKSIYES